MSLELVHHVSTIYQFLLSKKIVDKKDPNLRFYFEDPEIQEGVKVMARNFGTAILEAYERVHLISMPAGSVFASSFTQLKNKYSKVETKLHFYTVSFILFVYFTEIDSVGHGSRSRGEWQMEGMTFAKIAERVSSVLEYWEKRLAGEPDFSQKWGINIEEVIENWDNKDLLKLDQERKVKSTRTQFGYIQTAMKMLEDDKLVKVVSDQNLSIVYPLDALYDRIEFMFLDHERYQLIKRLIQGEDGEYAEH